MPRGPNIDRESVRKDILEKSTQIVVNDGFESLNVRKIASQIGCAVGTIYNVFKNLDEIVLHINASTLDEIYDIMHKTSSGCDSSIGTIKKLGHCYITFGQDNYHLWSMLFEHRLPTSDTPPDWYQEKIDKIFMLISDITAPLYNGDKKKSMLAATVLWAGLHGVCSLALSGSLKRVKAESASTLADSLIENYLSS